MPLSIHSFIDALPHFLHTSPLLSRNRERVRRPAPVGLVMSLLLIEDDPHLREELVRIHASERLDVECPSTRRTSSSRTRCRRLCAETDQRPRAERAYSRLVTAVPFLLDVAIERRMITAGDLTLDTAARRPAQRIPFPSHQPAVRHSQRAARGRWSNRDAPNDCFMLVRQGARPRFVSGKCLSRFVNGSHTRALSRPLNSAPTHPDDK